MKRNRQSIGNTIKPNSHKFGFAGSAWWAASRTGILAVDFFLNVGTIKTYPYHRPHFHVYYEEYEASVGVDGELLAGKLPVKQLKLVQAWAAIHEDELYAAWNNAVRNIPFGKIEPLR